MQATIVHSAQGFFNLDVEADPPEDGQTDVDAGLYYIDTETGIGYTRDAIDGDDAADGSWTARGKVLPFVGDQGAPGAPTGLAVVATIVENEDGTQVPGFTIDWDANSEDDLLGYVIHIEATTATWANPIEVLVGIRNAILIREGFVSGLGYDFRIAARDAEGYTSTWSPTVSGTAASDGTAPAVPGNVTLISGYRQLGVTWDRAAEADFAFYQVRRHLTSDAETAVVIETKSNHIILAGLTEDVGYDVDVRAIDLSGNVATSDVDLTGLPHLENPDTGWSVVVAETPTLIGSADIVAGSVVTNFLSTGTLSADQIDSGDLSVGRVGDPGTIEMFDAQGRSIGTLSVNGLVLINPDNTQEAMWLTAGVLKFSQVYDGDVDTTTWTTALNADGLNASAITFGTMGGGSNSIPNAGFELSVFAVLTSGLWTASAGSPSWDDATDMVHLDISGADLTMTSAR